MPMFRALRRLTLVLVLVVLLTGSLGQVSPSFAATQAGNQCRLLAANWIQHYFIILSGLPPASAEAQRVEALIRSWQAYYEACPA